MQPRILGILECAAASAAQTKLRATEGAQLRLKTYVRRHCRLIALVTTTKQGIPLAGGFNPSLFIAFTLFSFDAIVATTGAYFSVYSVIRAITTESPIYHLSISVAIAFYCLDFSPDRISHLLASGRRKCSSSLYREAEVLKIPEDCFIYMEWPLTQKETVSISACLFLLVLGFYMLKNPAIADFMFNRQVWNLKGRDRFYVRNILVWIFILIVTVLTVASVHLIITR